MRAQHENQRRQIKSKHKHGWHASEGGSTCAGERGGGSKRGTQAWGNRRVSKGGEFQGGRRVLAPGPVAAHWEARVQWVGQWASLGWRQVWQGQLLGKRGRGSSATAQTGAAQLPMRRFMSCSS